MGATPKPPKPPPFNPIDIPKTIADAIAYDIQGYNASDADFAQRFPGLVASRNNTIEDAYKQLVGPVDPTVENQFATNAAAKSLAVTGGGNPLAAIDAKGGASGNIAATSLANQLEQKQDYDRSYFQSLLVSNPQRAFGLSGADVANLSIFNTGGVNLSNRLQDQAAYAGFAAQGAQGVAIGNAISGIGGAIGGLSSYFTNPYTTGGYNGPVQPTTPYGYTGGPAYGYPSDERVKENIVFCGNSPTGVPIYEFTYSSGIGLPEGRYRGTIAQELMRIRPDAVITHEGGMMTVDYTMIDVKHEKI